MLLKTRFGTLAITFATAVVFFTSHVIFAEPPTVNLLTNDVLLSEQSVIFEKSSGLADSIDKVRVHYLTSNDCQSGYAGHYSTSSTIPFLITNGKPFGLNAASVYQSGVFALGSKKIESINSILINLIANTGRFAQFIGTCNDQGINCCIPVVCSNQTGTCLAKSDNGIQLFEEYFPRS